MHQRWKIDLLVGITLLTLAGCSKGHMSEEAYVKVMSELGCQMMMETAPGAKAIYAKHGVTQADIDAFRQQAREQVLTAATTIADNVAKCFNVTP